MRLLVDGNRFLPLLKDGTTYVFRLPAAPVRIASRIASPQELGFARDPRCLGVALRRIVVAQGTRVRVLEVEDGVTTRFVQT